MALTVAQIETLLVRRCGKRLALVGLTADPSGDASPRDYLADPIAEGLRSLGIAPADPTAPADADLSSVTGSDLPQLLDVAELRCLETVLGNWDLADEQAGIDRQTWSTLAEGVQKQLDTLRAKCRSLYGHGAAPLSIGTVDLNFAESGDPLDELVTQDF